MQRPIGFTESDILASARAQGRSAAFVSALAFLLLQEGVYFEIVDGDAGGATCCGVTQDDYDQWLKAHVLPSASVETISAARVSSLYFEHYWSYLGLDQFQYPVSLPLFDSAVNCGPREAVLFLQRELGVDDDGALGPNTLSAEHEYVVKHGALTLGYGILENRKAYYDEIGHLHPEDEQFEEGWHRRCDDCAAAICAAAGAK